MARRKVLEIIACEGLANELARHYFGNLSRAQFNAERAYISRTIERHMGGNDGNRSAA